MYANYLFLHSYAQTFSHVCKIPKLFCLVPHACKDGNNWVKYHAYHLRALEDLNMAAMIGTSHWPCWLAEACRILLPLAYGGICSPATSEHVTGLVTNYMSVFNVMPTAGS